MDLHAFDGEALYFDQPLSEEVAGLIADAADAYGSDNAECPLLRAYFLAPEHLSVLVALYRYFYYRHRYQDALLVAERAIAVAAAQLGLTADWRQLSPLDLEQAGTRSMTLTRFFLLALKGSGYLLLRLAQPAQALERLTWVQAVDTENRLDVGFLVQLAETGCHQERIRQAGDKVRSLF